MIDKLRAQAAEAMKAGNKERLSALRMMMTALQTNATSEKPVEDVKVILGYRKQVQESILTANAERAAALNAELAVVNEFLPREATVEEVTAFARSLPAALSFGEKMAKLKVQFATFDGKKMSEIVKGLV